MYDTYVVMLQYPLRRARWCYIVLIWLLTVLLQLCKAGDGPFELLAALLAGVFAFPWAIAAYHLTYWFEWLFFRRYFATKQAFEKQMLPFAFFRLPIQIVGEGCSIWCAWPLGTVVWDVLLYLLEIACLGYCLFGVRRIRERRCVAAFGAVCALQLALWALGIVF